jgi:SAM-dependent MidA family methyltransferase
MPSRSRSELPPGLLERLRRVADPSGFVRFDRFMELALYAPGLGYYTRERSPLGPAGDFYTASHVSPLFAQALAQKLASVAGELAPGSPATFVELGSGDGALAEGVVRALTTSASLGRPFTYVVVERSGGLRQRSLARLRAAVQGASVSVRDAPSLAEVGPVAGAVVASELLDAQPVRRFRRREGEWAELGVWVQGPTLVEAERPIGRALAEPLPSAAEEGAVVERSPAAEAIVREIADHLVAGRALLLDYGMEESELLAGHPRGTLAAVRGHRAIDDPLDLPGSTDLSVFVNFTRVRTTARAVGLTEVAFERQAEALGRWGFPALLDRELAGAPSEEAKVRLRLAAKNLLFGFDRFRVLELAPAGAGPLGTARVPARATPR